MARQCDPLVEIFLEQIRAGPVVQMDETRLQVMKELGRADTAQSFMWVIRGGPPENPVILYRYHPSHSAKIPLVYLSDYKGYLQTDGYEAYADVGALEGITHVGCWAHYPEWSVIRSKRCQDRSAGSSIRRGYWCLAAKAGTVCRPVQHVSRNSPVPVVSCRGCW